MGRFPRIDEFWQLVLFRLRFFLREGGTLFWSLVFPLISVVAIGVAFQHHKLDDVPIAVADGPHAEAIAAELGHTAGAQVVRTTLSDGTAQLARGKVSLVLEPGPSPKLFFDPTRDDCRVAKLMTLDALERYHGNGPTIRALDHPLVAPGTRYIDFVFPGLLAQTLMLTSLNTVAVALVWMRKLRILKPFVASPVSRTSFLGSFVVGRALIALVEIAVITLAGCLLFKVPIHGSLIGYSAFALFGALAFCGLGLLIGSRSEDAEGVMGAVNLAIMVMMLVSGVFFSTSRFPGWAQPLIAALPLTALVDGLRSIMSDGMVWRALWAPVLILCLWGVLPAAAAWRLFRGN